MVKKVYIIITKITCKTERAHCFHSGRVPLKGNKYNEKASANLKRS